MISVNDEVFRYWLYAWPVIVLFVVYWYTWKSRAGAGFVIAYVLIMFANYWPGAFVYLDPHYSWFPRYWEFNGFVLASQGLLAFVVGAILVDLFHKNKKLDLVESDSKTFDSTNVMHMQKNAYSLLFIGSVSYFILTPLLGSVPSLGALISGLNKLVLVGIFLGIWSARNSGLQSKVIWLSIAALLPVITLVLEGFLGYGITMLVAVVAFFISVRKARLWYVPVAIVVVYVGLSGFVTYMRDRSDLREVIWGGAQFETRLDRVGGTFIEDWEWFDSQYLPHQRALDSRLNLSWQTGAAKEYISQGREQYSEGYSIVSALFAIIPRVIWADKPSIGGGGDIVTKFTGVQFAEGTSVGAGQIFEFFVNFGSKGLWISMMCFGAGLRWLDHRSRQMLENGNTSIFVVYTVMGLSMLQVGGNLTEISSSMVAAALAVLAINKSGILN